MRIAALIIGIFGSVAGFIGAVFAVFVGGLGGAFGAEGAEQVTGLGFGALIASIVALVGAALAITKPRTSAILMGVSAIAGLIFVSFAFVLGTILLLIATLLAFLGRNQGQSQEGQTTE